MFLFYDKLIYVLT